MRPLSEAYHMPPRYGPVGNVRRGCFAPTLPLFDVLIVLVSCAVLTLFQSFLL